MYYTCMLILVLSYAYKYLFRHIILHEALPLYDELEYNIGKIYIAQTKRSSAK